MKLNAFIDKPQKRINKQSNVFHLGNEAKENKLQDEVAELRSIEDKYKELRQVTSGLEGDKPVSYTHLTLPTKA